MTRIMAILTCLVALSCSGGKGKECPLGTSECGGYCIDVLGSYRNCGDCGVRCGDGQGCDQGACVPWCPATPVADAAALTAVISEYAAGRDPLENRGRSGSFEASSEITLTRADLSSLGDVVLSAGGVEGVLSSTPAASVFNDLSDCVPEMGYDPSWYESIAISAGTRFLVTVKGLFLSLEGSSGGTCCGADKAGQYCHDGTVTTGYCSVPFCGCCCSPDQIDPLFVQLRLPPQECTSMPTCPETSFIGQTPSGCYEDYAHYLWSTSLDEECVDATGHFLGDGAACTAHGCEGDVIMDYPGECGADGGCDRVID